MQKFLIRAMTMNHHYAMANLQDIAPEHMCDQPIAGMNHPAFIVGHLAASCEMAIRLLGGTSRVPDGWEELFGFGSSPLPDADAYPQWPVLLQAYDSGHERLSEMIATTDLATMDAPMPVPEMREFFPTLGDFVTGIATYHEGIHLGQLSQ